MPEPPEIPGYTQPDFVYDIGCLIRLTFYKSYPDFFYIGMIPAGRTVAISVAELVPLIEALRNIVEKL